MTWIRTTTELVHLDADPVLYVDCEYCKRPLTLAFGAELDRVDCPCGRRQYELEVGSVNLVTRRFAP